MSTEATDRAGSARGDDEEWLYGDDDDNDVDPEDNDDDDKTETEVFSALVGDVEDFNGVTNQDGNESESDSDDDVRVTIGDIKTGGSQNNTGVSLNIKASSRAAVSGLKAREGDLDSVNTAVLKADVESTEEKPWKKPGADLSDYFNYGFNEDTWKAYCDKQRKLRMSLEVMTLGSSSKFMANRGELSSKFDYSSKKLSSSINVNGGQSGTISRVEGRRRHNTDGNNTQVQSSSEQLSDAKSQSSKLPPFFPPNIPPPPLPPLSISSATPPLIPPPPRLHMSVPPPGFPLPPGVPSPPSLITTLDSSRSGGSYDGRSTPSFPFPAGGVVSWPGLIDNAKAWDYYGRQDKQRDREREKDRKRTRERDRERERNREREREHTPSYQAHSSDEDSRRRDHSDRERERHRERSARDGEREDRYRERRHRDRNERHKSSRSSYSRRRHTSDEAESHRRHRHKRSRHNRDSTEASEECSAEHDNQSEPTE